MWNNFYRKVIIAMRYRINKFDPKTLKPHQRYVFVGRSGGGKTVAMRHVLYEMRGSVDLALCFTPSLAAKHAFRRIVPAAFMRETLDLSTLDKALNMQTALLENKKERSILVVADDCMYDKAIWRSPTIRRVFMQGRHANLGMALSVQYLMDLPPDLRTNCGYVFCTADAVHQNKKRLFNAFFGCFEKYS